MFPEPEVARTGRPAPRTQHAEKRTAFTLPFSTFLQAFYGAHPYNHTGLGSRDGLESITRDDLLALHSTLLRPDRMVFSVVRDITVDEVLDASSAQLPGTLRGRTRQRTCHTTPACVE